MMSRHTGVPAGPPFRCAYGASRCLLLLSFIAVALLCGSAGALRSAAPDPRVHMQQSADRNAERYLTILRRRPRPGVALDRLYLSFNQSGLLQDVLKTLQEDETQSEQAGRDRMVAGWLQLRVGETRDALRLFREAELRLSDDPGPPWGRGIAHLKRGELADAVHAFDESLRRTPAIAEAAEILLDRGRALVRSDRIDAAEENWQRLMRLDPEDHSLPTRISDLLIEEQRGDLAVSLLESRLRQTASTDQQIEYRQRLAEALVQTRRIEPAIAELREALRLLAPGSGRARAIRARLDEVLRGHASLTRRREFYEQWVREHPADVEAQLRLVDVFAELKDFSQAESVLLRLMENAPARVDLKERYVSLLRRSGRMADAVQQQTELIVVQPGNLNHRELLGRLWLERHELPEAERQQQAAEVWLASRAVAEDDPVKLSRIAGWLTEIGRRTAARELYESAVRTDPSNATWRELLGAFHHENGNRELALQSWQQIADGDRRSAGSLFALADVLRQFGYIDEASETVQQVSREFPSLQTHLQCAEFFDRSLQYDASMAQLWNAEKYVGNEREREVWEASLQQALRASVRRQTQAGQLDQAVDLQRQLWQRQQNAATRRGLVELLLLRASQLQRRQRPEEAVPLHLEALKLDAALYAGEFETHIQTFEHARQLPRLVQSLEEADLAPFEPHARLVLRLCADELLEHPESSSARRLVRRLLQEFPDKRAALQRDVESLGLSITAHSEESVDGQK